MTAGIVTNTTTFDSTNFQIVETGERVKKGSAFLEATAAALRDSQINDSSSNQQEQDRRNGYTI